MFRVVFCSDSSNVRRMHTAVRLNEAIVERSHAAKLVILNLPGPPKHQAGEQNCTFYLFLGVSGFDRVSIILPRGRLSPLFPWVKRRPPHKGVLQLFVFDAPSGLEHCKRFDLGRPFEAPFCHAPVVIRVVAHSCWAWQSMLGSKSCRRLVTSVTSRLQMALANHVIVRFI